MTLAERLHSAEDLLSMEEGDAFELDDGVLVELSGDFESAAVALQLLFRLGNCLDEDMVGRVVPISVGLDIFPHEQRCLFRPDGGFISYDRLARGVSPKGFLTVAPELLIESISPGDKAAYMHRKINEYLAAGVLVVWVLYPEMRLAQVYRANGMVTIIPSDGFLDGEDVIPGFRCALAEIMPPLETA